jgi:UPF0271 protein
MGFCSPVAKSYKIDINVDMGESFGHWSMGRPELDEEILAHVTSCNVACGFHAGDPHVMRRTVKLAKKYGVRVGAHPGLPDLIGFGRRRMDVTPAELTDYIVYQTGALRAIAASEQVGELQHVLIHGTACLMSWYEEKYAEAYVNAMLQLDPGKGLIMYGARGGPGPKYVLDEIAKRAGLRTVAYAIGDMDYNPDGSLVMLREHPPVDIPFRVERIMKMIKEGVLLDVNRNPIPYKPHSFLVHSDTPNVVELLKSLELELAREGVERVPVSEIV